MRSKVKIWVGRRFEHFAAMAIAVLSAVICIVEPAVARFPSPPPPIREVFYYDTVTGELYSGPVEEFPPIATPKGSLDAQGQGAGVKANVFSCGKCVAEEWYIGYLETYLPPARQLQIRMREEMKRLAEQPSPPPGPSSGGAPPMPMGPTAEDMAIVSEGHLVATATEPNKWFRQESPEGAALVNAAMKKCSDQKYSRQCFPGRPDYGMGARFWTPEDYMAGGLCLGSLVGGTLIAWALMAKKPVQEQTGMRGWINRNTVVVTVVSVILLYLALLYCL